MESLSVGLCHSKPKKSVATAIVPEDYICTQGDLALIDFIKEIPCEPRVEVVLIDDAFVERKSMECLFQPNAYLGDEVIDCYINLIKAQKHLKCRFGGRVHIENAFQFNFLKRDGDVEIKTEELYDSEVVYEDEEGPITQADLQKWFVDDWDKRAPVKVSNDGCTNDFLMVGLSTKDMPLTKADSIDVLCDYIMAIEDDSTLEMTWVRSFNPFKIEISVKDLQNILTINLDMTLRCFDMAVRLLANKESRRPKGEIINNRKHYMDMRFWVLMPWKFNGCHALFVIDHVKKHVTFIDFTPTQDWCKHMPYKRFAEAIIMASKKYKIAYSKKRSGWAEDIFKWEHTIQTDVPIDLRGFNTSYLVLQAMAMWGNDRRMKFVGDAKIVRRNFVIDLLSYEDNSC
ncbi:hypothetical protein Zm00014a_013134 [Zea mays]|uniref:Ubiquitin-like protease family profile domain-containing protein n=1 Tax=Zea mays TaxID=4577 RepID=A0A3L6DLT0_MAIZE|nr:hypothetical protein Zm00014a_013134 [Zea mays]